MLRTVSELIVRDLSRIQGELELYGSESEIWEQAKGISNSGGNLALHVAGNLQHFIGAVLGNSGYKRNREFEFAAKNLPLQTLISEIENARSAVETTLSELDEGIANEDFPIEVFGKPMTNAWFLMHLVSHTSYHLGQINYHRRMISGIASGSAFR